ncbi:unnamed protein product [Rhizophagus irregularis]|uniref:Uncharacterized protein n=1 Tax=Rhizophagus irregularis TaxID=588596 RepID=A0A916E8U8_9GLOM|nr:unnamed protein product [Rhizophagus irregularis]CAB5371570.1 unnamed protein product [Rhizophagus irregularis]CAB5390298.1 unnamed protein product [Rhizophagus irregularis]
MKQGLSTVFKDTTIYAYLVDGFGAKRDVCNERIIISHGGGKSYKQNELSAITIIIGKGSCAILRTWGKLEGGENLNDEEALNETKRL